MKPILTITDTYQETDKLAMREKNILLFGLPIYRLVETGDRVKDKPVGFTPMGVSLTEIKEEEYDE